MAYYCKFCDAELESVRHLSGHLRCRHEVTLEAYYLIDHPRTNCQTCGGETTFKNFKEGFNKICGSRKCSCLWHRMTLANDPARNDAFTNKVSENQTRIWASRTEEECSAIRHRGFNHLNEWQPWMTAIIATDDTLIREALGIQISTR